MEPLNLHQVELFCAVVERGSFALAGAELFITPSALSVQVKRLERDLGIALLRRRPDGMVPTEAGRELYAVGRAMLDLRQAGERRMSDLRHGRSGTISLCVVHTAPLYYLTEVLRDFRAAHTDIQARVQIGEREELIDAMLRGSLDLGLDWGPITRAGVVPEVLLEEPFVIVAAPDHPLAGTSCVSREEFARQPFLGLQFGVRTPGFSETAMSEAGLRPNVVMRLPSTDAVKRLAEAGLGIGCMGRIAAERELAAGQLTSLTVEGLSLNQPLLVFRPEGPLRSPALAAFYRFIFQHPRVRKLAPEQVA